MIEILLYTTSHCPYCRRAKSLLAAKGVAFTEIDLLEQPEKQAEMTARSGGRITVPQIFIGGIHIGGSDELFSLEGSGDLDRLLKHAEAA